MNDSESNAGTPKQASSLHEVDGRREVACELERWRVDEWCEPRNNWWVLEHHETYAKAAAQLDYLAKNCAAPKRRWRVVWIRERVQLLSESPIDPKLSDGGAWRGSCDGETKDGIQATKKGGPK